ncbi:MAG: hypothetical protein U0359_32355 [Byssovorax sp.]
MRNLLFFALAAPFLACACASSIPPASAPAATPAAAPADSSAPAAGLDPACEQVCARIETCSKRPATSCRADCAEHLAPEGKAAAYLRCVTDLSCEAITESLMMNSGPLGYCRTGGR